MGWKDTIQENPDAAPKSWRDTVQDSSADAGPKQGWGETLVRGATGTLPYLGALGTGALAAETGPGMLPAAGVGYATGKEAERLANHYLLGDDATDSVPQAAKRLGGNFTEGMLAETGGQVLSKGIPVVGGAIKSGAGKLASNPVFDWIANKAAKPVVEQAAEPIADYGAGLFTPPVAEAAKEATQVAAPQWAKKAANAAVDFLPIGGFGRMGVRKAIENPEVAQKSLSWIVENVPQKLGKFAGVLQDAAKRGNAAFATTSFLLQQSDAEFQKIMKDNEEAN